MTLLTIKNLQVEVSGKHVLYGVNLVVGKGEVHTLMGANGSGKSSLAQALMGDARYQILDSSGGITFAGKNLLRMSVDERAKVGLFVAWQNPIMIPGVSVFSLCKASYEATGHAITTLVAFKQQLEALALRVGLTKEHISRSVNEGFSGGERKRLELLQLLLLQPKLVVFDEIDSGLDSRGVKLVVQIIKELKETGVSFILITHNKLLRDTVLVDTTWEMHNGRISAGL